MNIKIKNANYESFSYIKGMRTGAEYRFYDYMYAVLNPDRASPLSCVSVANNSLSIDLWTGCTFQCAYCHVQGIKEDINEEGKMRIKPIKRNNFTIDQIIDELIEHPFFRRDQTIISIGTSSTEPFAKGPVLESTLEIMNNFIRKGFKNPFWIVTKAGIPSEAINELIDISRNIERLIISVCWANNPKEIEPVQNNRFRNIEKLQSGNISINWYLRPIAKEWLKGIDKVEAMFHEISSKYSQYIDCIVPGGLRWTEGIEYGLVEARGLELPNISKFNNTKTLNNDDWEQIMKLSKKYFPDKPVFYHSSCAISLALSKSNISMTNFSKKKDCNKSECPVHQRKKCEIKENINVRNIQKALDKVGFGIKVIAFNEKNGQIETMPAYESLSPAMQQEINHTIALLNNRTESEFVNEINSKFNINKNLKIILEKLKSVKQVSCIAFVGSIVYSEEPKDIDLLVLVENVKNNNEAIKIIRNSLSNYEIVQCDDSIRITDVSDLDINIAVFDLNYFNNKVKNIFENNQIYGEHRNWCLGYWLPEVLIKDILDAKVYFEKEENRHFLNLVAFVKENHEKILDRIEKECIKEMQMMSSQLLKIKNEKVFQFYTFKNSLILALIRYSFLKNKKVGTSFKNINVLSDQDMNFNKYIENLIGAAEGKEVVQLTNSVLREIGGKHFEKAMLGNLAI